MFSINLTEDPHEKTIADSEGDPGKQGNIEKSDPSNSNGSSLVMLELQTSLRFHYRACI